MMHSINCSGLYAAVFFLMFSCGEEELECDPLVDPACASTIAPEASIITETGTIFTESTVTIQWEGNETAQSFNWRVESTSYDDHPINIYQQWQGWTADNTITSIKLEYLDEGDYVFYIKARLYDGGVEQDSVGIDFTIDAIPETVSGFRIYPLKQYIDSLDTTVDIFLYADNFTSYMGAEIKIVYNAAALEYIPQGSQCDAGNEGGEIGGMLCNQSGEEEDSDYGYIKILNWHDSGSFNSMQLIDQINFNINNLRESEITIDTAFVRDSNNLPMTIGILQNAQIEVLSP